MSKLVFLSEDGCGNIYNESGVEAMDIVDEKGDPHALKQLVNLRTYLMKNSSPDNIEEQSVEVNETLDIPMRTAPVRPNKYKNHDVTPREMFFHYKLQELLSVRAAALKADVKESTARYWWNNYQKDPEKFVLGKQTNRKNRPPALLQDEHKKHLINFFDENNQATIQDAVEELMNKFSGLEIKKSRVHEFMKDECNLSMKKATFWPEARNSEDNLQKRLQWVMKWSQTDMDFFKNCIFIDESGFDINMKSSRAWAPKGKDAIVTRPLTKAPSHSVIGAISSVGVVNLSIRVPKMPPKIRKIQGGAKERHQMPHPEMTNLKVQLQDITLDL